MTWIKTPKPPFDPLLAHAMKEAGDSLPGEYAPARRGERRLPPEVANDSIVLSHALIPEALRHSFMAYGAMMRADLPLSRRDHELIATTVSRLNDCHY